MRATTIVLLLAAMSWVSRAEGVAKRCLYMTTPDAAQEGGSGEGLLLFDVDWGHRFVRRIDVPSFKEGVRGVNACAATGRLYVTTSAHRLVCMDLKTDQVLWEISASTSRQR